MIGLTYLATPYSHQDAEVRQQRFDAVNVAAAKLMKIGYHIYSPISHSHPIALVGDMPTGWGYWETHDKLIIEKCSQMIVLMQDGWKDSSGVAAEIAFANEIGIPVLYMEH